MTFSNLVWVPLLLFDLLTLMIARVGCASLISVCISVCETHEYLSQHTHRCHRQGNTFHNSNNGVSVSAVLN